MQGREGVQCYLFPSVHATACRAVKRVSGGGGSSLGGGPDQKKKSLRGWTKADKAMQVDIVQVLSQSKYYSECNVPKARRAHARHTAQVSEWYIPKRKK